jgi:O-antigen ligase
MLKVRGLGIVTSIAFYILTVITMLNLNGLSSMTLGIDRLFSPIILVTGIIILFINRRFIFSALGELGFIFIIFVFAYLSIGTLSSLLYMSNLDTVLPVYISIINTSFIVIVGALIGYRVSLKNNMESLISILYLISFGAVLSIFYGAWNPAIYYSIEHVGFYSSRYSGFFANPNVAGIAICLSTSIALSCINSGRLKIITLIGILLSLIAVYLTFSRSSILIFVVLIAVQIFLVNKNKLFKWRFLIIIIGVMFVCYFLLINMTLFLELDTDQTKRIDSLISLLHTGKIESHLRSHRDEIFFLSLERIASSPIIGNGLGSFLKLSGSIWGSHNTYLMILGEAGIVTILIFLFFIYRVFVKTRKCQSVMIKSFVINIFITLVIACVFSHNVLQHRNMNLLIGLCIGFLSGRKKVDGNRSLVSHFK